MPGERSKDARAVVTRLLRLVRGELARLIAVLIASIAGVIFNVLGPRVLGHGTDVIIAGVQHGGLNFSKLHNVLWQAISVYVGTMVCTLFTAWVLAGVVQRLMRRLRSDVEEKIHRLPLSYIDRESRGDLLSRVIPSVSASFSIRRVETPSR